jgi:hypothetical protein
MPTRTLLIVAIALSACIRRQPFEDPAYASLPRINLLMVHHGGVALSRAARDVRYEIEAQLAEERIAVAGGPYDAAAPEFSLDLVDTGLMPGGEARGLNGWPNSISSPPSPTNPAGVPDTGAPDPWPGDEPRVLDGFVYMRRPRQEEMVLVGRVRGIVGPDIASSAKMAEIIASLIRRGLSS